jgi:hypothetical protein
VALADLGGYNEPDPKILGVLGDQIINSYLTWVENFAYNEVIEKGNIPEINC